MYLDDVISSVGTVMEPLGRLEEVLCRLSNFGLQLEAKKCTFMQTEVGFPTEDGRFVLDTDASLFAASCAPLSWVFPQKTDALFLTRTPAYLLWEGS